MKNKSIEEVTQKLLVALDVATANLDKLESELWRIALRLADADEMFDISETDVLNMVTALSTLGIPAPLCCAALIKIIKNISIAVSIESQELLTSFASVQDMTPKQFADAWKINAPNTLINFIEGLSGSVFQDDTELMTDLGLTDKRLSDVINKIGSSGDLLRNSINR